MTRSRIMVLAGALVVALALGMPTSNASHVAHDCRNEEHILTGGDDVNVNVGPDVLVVGVDKGDQFGGNPDPTPGPGVCVGSGTLGVELVVGAELPPLPRTESGDSCAVDVLGGLCEVEGFEVWFGDGQDRSARVTRQGTPADGNTVVTIPGSATCVVAVGSDC